MVMSEEVDLGVIDENFWSDFFYQIRKQGYLYTNGGNWLKVEHWHVSYGNGRTFYVVAEADR